MRLAVETGKTRSQKNAKERDPTHLSTARLVGLRWNIKISVRALKNNNITFVNRLIHSNRGYKNHSIFALSFFVARKVIREVIAL